MDVFQTLIPVAAEVSADRNLFILYCHSHLGHEVQYPHFTAPDLRQRPGSKNSFFQRKLDFSLLTTGFFSISHVQCTAPH